MALIPDDHAFVAGLGVTAAARTRAALAPRVSCAARTTSAMLTVLTALAALTAVVGCDNDNPNFCPDNPNDNCLDDAGIDSPPACTSSSTCAAPTPACDLPSGVCVECTAAEPAACADTTPVCGDDLACRGCTAHLDCVTSATCLPDGSCANPDDVAYVSPTGTVNASCDQTTTCTPTAALATARPYVKFAAGTTKDPAGTITIEGRAVTVLAEPAATLDRDGDGRILLVRGVATEVRIYDLEVSGATGIADEAIRLEPNGGTPMLALTRASVRNNQGAGIAASGGSLSLAQSTVSGNSGGGIAASGGSLSLTQSTISGNSGGGIAITGSQFDITNCLIVENGGPSSTYGGLKVDGIVGAGTRRLELSTIAYNDVSTGLIAGVACSTIAVPLTFSSNIVVENDGASQVSGANCNWTHSLFRPQAVTGTGNLNIDPRFVDPINDDFHLQPDSPARDAADPAATLATDVDGEVRPQGPARDMGADEVYP